VTRVLRTSLIKDKIVVSLDLSELDRVFEERSLEMLDQVVSEVKGIMESYGLKEVRVEERLSSIEILGKGKANIFGFIEREINELERRILEKAGHLEHEVYLFYNVNKLSSVRIIVYSVEPRPPKSPTGHRIIAKLCNSLTRHSHLFWGELGSAKVATLEIGSAVLSEEFKVYVDNVEFKLKLFEVRELDFLNKWDRELFKRIVNRALKSKLRAKGYKIRGLTVIIGSPIFTHELVNVWSACDIQTLVFSNGYIALAISPRHIIEATKNLWESYGTKEEMLKYVKELRGMLVRSKVNLLTYRIVDILDVSVSEPLKQLGGVSLVKLYSNYTLDPSEPVIVVNRGGVLDYYSPSLLIRIYNLQELRKMGLSREVYRRIKLSLIEWPQRASTIIKDINPLDVEGLVIEFSEEPIVSELL